MRITLKPASLLVLTAILTIPASACGRLEPPTTPSSSATLWPPGTAAARPVSAAPSAGASGSSVALRFGNQSVPRGADNTHAAGYVLMQDLGMTAIREGWNWKNIEIGPQQYVSWMDYFDDKAKRFAELGVSVEAMVTDTPSWAATSVSGQDPAHCVPRGLNEPIFADGSDQYHPGAQPNPKNTYAEYFFTMVSRFKGHVALWQVWNEPDFPSGDLNAAGTSGGDRYWTGSVTDYVRLLHISRVVARALDPAARIALGGLGYEGYLAGILDHGGGDDFDVVDFHAYGSGDAHTSSDVLTSSWGFLGRYQAMKQVLSAHGVSGKTFVCSETGMSADDPGEQAAYVTKALSTAAGLGDVEMLHWAVFTNPGFRNMGLIDQATLTQKTQGYLAYRTLAHRLSGAKCLGAIDQPGVSGQRFQAADGSTLWVAWATQANATLTMPAGTREVSDAVGKVQNLPTSGTMPLTGAPILASAP